MGVALEYRVYLEDTDAGGIVYHASYLRLMERARTELLRAAGFQQSQTFRDDVGYVVRSMQLEFVSPAKLDDVVTVSCEVTATRGASFTVEQLVRNQATGATHCSAVACVVCIRLSDQKPRRLPNSLLTYVSNGCLAR